MCNVNWLQVFSICSVAVTAIIVSVVILMKAITKAEQWLDKYPSRYYI